MTELPRDFKSKKITVKIDNMKRRSYGDSPPMSRKKRHSSISRYDGSSDERGSPERVRRRARSPPSPRASRYSERDEFGRSRDLDRSHPTYKVLCVSALHPKASDDQVKETLYREYRKFGEFSVRISHELDERVAYVCFRSSEDARDAKHTKPRISLFDKIALVAPVYEGRSSRDHYEPRARRSRSQSFSPDFDRYYRRSPIPPELHRPHPVDRFYERLPYAALPPILPPRDFREIGLPPLHPHELMIPRGPLLHHVAPIHPHLGPIHPLYGPPRHFMPPFRPHPHPHLMHDKKDKFPNYLHHIPPEDDPLATRTLFAGNLEISISDEELRRIFGRYGVVEDIDVKRPLPGTGNAYAFVRYQNLDMAHRAKVELSGQYLGKFQCKIGYGKSTPTQRIWVGGLGPWTSLAQLEREFDRFGVIKKIEYVKGDICAYIQFESIDAATAAVKEMRGVALGGPEHKLRTDFADGGVCGSPTLTYSSKSKSSHDDVAATAGDLRELTRRDEYSYGWPDGEYPSYNSRGYRKGRTEYSEESRKFGNYENGRSFKQHSVSDIGSPRSPERSPLHQSIDSDVESEEGAIQSAGVEEAISAGKTLKQRCYQFDVAHTSVLKRAQDTLSAILNQIDQTNIPVQTTWRLNERHYGGLTGLNKSETAEKYGEDQVKVWRRSFDIPPPPMEINHPHYDHIKNNPYYAEGPSECEFPTHESLKMTIHRTLPYWDCVIVPQIKKNKRILLAAHGNSLRGIIKYLDNITDKGIMELNLPTGIPFEYTLDENLKPLVSMKFLGDDETVKKAMDAVASQGKAK